MSNVIIGSARINEKGKATGGKNGDQKQTSTPDYRGEVSMQEFYVHKLGWYVIRPKKSAHATKIAKCMKKACNNKHVGYGQDGRLGIIRYGVGSVVDTEADCGTLVRECVKEATGTDPGDFYTGNEVEKLEATGLFKKAFEYTNGTKLYTGDILVTRVKGHTAIVVAGETKDNGVRVAKPTLRKGNKSEEVGVLQKNLIALGFRGKDGKVLEVDDDFGKNTDYAVRNFQDSRNIEVDGIYGSQSADAMEDALNG